MSGLNFRVWDLGLKAFRSQGTEFHGGFRVKVIFLKFGLEHVLALQLLSVSSLSFLMGGSTRFGAGCSVLVRKRTMLIATIVLGLGGSGFRGSV